MFLSSALFCSALHCCCSFTSLVHVSSPLVHVSSLLVHVSRLIAPRSCLTSHRPSFTSHRPSFTSRPTVTGAKISSFAPASQAPWGSRTSDRLCKTRISKNEILKNLYHYVTITLPSHREIYFPGYKFGSAVAPGYCRSS